METRLIIFFGLTFVVLAWNAVLLWVLHQMFRRAGARAAESGAQVARLRDGLHSGGRKLEDLSGRLAALSSRMRTSVRDVDDTLRRADNWARYGLAKLDFNADRVSERLRSKTAQFGRDIHEPLYRTAAVIHGTRAVLELLPRSDDGREWLPKTRRAVRRLDTVATIVQSVTALGELFSPNYRASRLRKDATGNRRLHR